MRIVLEREDLVLLLGKALDIELTPEDVKISTDPFEVTVNKAEKVLKAPPEPKEEVRRGVPEEEKEVIPTTEPPIPDTPLEDLLGANDALASSVPPVGGGGGGRSASPPPPTIGGREQ